MSNIFEKINNILNSLNESKFPVHDDMKTKEQGEDKAWEKIAKYFLDIPMNGGGPGLTKSSEPELPDDFIDPVMKDKMKPKDKDFKENKVDWGEDDESDKLKKEFNGGDENDEDEFDDFDYKNNPFGDDNEDETEPQTPQNKDLRTESEKLEDEIDNALDELKDNKSGGKSSNNSSKSGQGSDSNGGNDEEGYPGGEDGEGEDGEGEDGDNPSNSGKGNGSNGGSRKGNDEEGYPGGEDEEGEDGDNPSNSGKGNGSNGGSRKGNDEEGYPGVQEPTDEESRKGGDGPSVSRPETRKDEKIKEIEDAIKRGESVKKIIDDIKNGKESELPGEVKDIDDNDLKDDLKKTNLTDEEINDVLKSKNDDSQKVVDEDELEEEKQRIIKELEDHCKNGESALASTISRWATNQKIKDVNWEKVMEMFLEKRAEVNGDKLKTRSGIKFGNKAHLWRHQILPTYTEKKQGDVATIYCFVDFSGSVNKNLVFTFLGKVMDLCMKFDFTDIVVYGVGDRIVEPRTITKGMVESKGKKVELENTWSFIDKQVPGAGSTNFADIGNTIKSLWSINDNSVFLIFGDGKWDTDDARELKTRCSSSSLDSTAILIYYENCLDFYQKRFTDYLKYPMKFKHLIITKAAKLLV